MILTDFSNIKIGNTDISSVYMGAEKLWPKGTDTGTTGDRRTMRFTTTDGNTWNKDYISAYTADNRLIEPTEKNATGWTYGEDVEYLGSTAVSGFTGIGNLLSFNGFGVKTKIRNAFEFFYQETKLTEIDTKYFDTSETTDMSEMFNSCRIKSLDLSHFNTSNVTNMNKMFYSCNYLKSLDLSNWDLTNVTNINKSMFYACGMLRTITMKNCSPETVQKIKSAVAFNVTIITE